MVDLKNINDSNYQTITDSVQSDNNIRRKAFLLKNEAMDCVKAHLLDWIREFKKINNRFPYIVEVLDETAKLKEELSLSRDGKGLEVYTKIMIREQKIKDKKKKEKDDDDR